MLEGRDGLALGLEELSDFRELQKQYNIQTNFARAARGLVPSFSQQLRISDYDLVCKSASD